MMPSGVRFEEIEKALTSLERALAQPLNEFTRDAAIQRFEFTFELTWKVAKKVLASHGIQSSTPRSVIRDLAQQGWITDPSAWMKFLDDRNLTSHTYNESVAQEVHRSASAFAGQCRALIKKLKSV